MGEVSWMFLGSRPPGRHLPLCLPAAGSESQKTATGRRAKAPRASLTLLSRKEMQEHLRHIHLFTKQLLRPKMLQGLSYGTAGTEVGRPSRRVYPLIRDKDGRYTEKQNHYFEGDKIGDGAETRGGQL